MTTEKLISVLNFYHQQLTTGSWCNDALRGRSAIATPNEDPAFWQDHCAWMCRCCLDTLIPANDLDKAMRWLGFIQGQFFANRIYTIQELRNHSRPDVA